MCLACQLMMMWRGSKECYKLQEYTPNLYKNLFSIMCEKVVLSDKTIIVFACLFSLV